VLLIGLTYEQNLRLAIGCPTYTMQALLPHPFSAFHVFFQQVYLPDFLKLAAQSLFYPPQNTVYFSS